MKIGIIVHSHTGNTLSVARRLGEKLAEAGHLVSLEQVKAVDDEKAEVGSVRFESKPAADGYEALIFAAPVRGLSLSPAMTDYLSQLAPLGGKKAACFVTEAFPYPWMGGSRAVGQMKKICEARGMQVCGTGVVNWSGAGRRERLINELTGKFCSLF